MSDDRNKIGLLLPQHMLYIFESEESIRNLAPKSLEPVFSATAAKWDAPSKINSDNIMDAYSELVKENVRCVLVFGDDASAQLFAAFKSNPERETVPVATVLSGIDVDQSFNLGKKHLKFWFTQEYETLLLLNWLLDKKRGNSNTSPPVVSLFALNAKAPQEHCEIFEKLICEQYHIFQYKSSPILWNFGEKLRDDVVSDETLESEAIFISGYADFGHIDLINKLINKKYSGYVLTNAALSTIKFLDFPQRVLPFKDNAIFYTGIGSTNIKLFYTQLIQTIFGYLSDILKNKTSFNWQDTRTFTSSFGAVLDIAENGNMALPLSRWKLYYDEGKKKICQELEYTPKPSEAGFTEIASFLHFLSEFSFSLVHHYQNCWDAKALIDKGKTAVNDLEDQIKKLIDPVGQATPMVFLASLERGKKVLFLDNNTDKFANNYPALFSLVRDCVADETIGDVVQLNLKKEDFPNNSSARFWLKTKDNPERFVTLSQWLAGNDDIQVKSLHWTKTRNILKNNDFIKLKHYDNRCFTEQEYDNLKQELQKLCPQFNFIYIFIYDVGIKGATGIMLLFNPRKKLSRAILQVLLSACRELFAKYYGAQNIIFLREASTKSAIGSIMSRNGSHNIGSHVLAALTNNVGTMPDDRILYQYIQQRMDYVATVTTDFPVWGNATRFVGDMMKTFFSQSHLLNYISRSEGLHAYHFQDPSLSRSKLAGQTDTIKIHIRRIEKNIGRGSENGNNHDTTSLSMWELTENPKAHALHFICYPDRKGIHYDTKTYNENTPLPLDQDVSLDIPGGVIGEHAFFTILENVIRNAAKHGWAGSPASGQKNTDPDSYKNLDIYIDFADDPEKGEVKFVIWDNVSDVLKPMRQKDGADHKRYARLLQVLGNVDSKKSKCVFTSQPLAQVQTRAEWIKVQFNFKDNLPKKLLAADNNNYKSNCDELDKCIKSVSGPEFERVIRSPLSPEEIKALKQALEREEISMDDLPLHWRQQLMLDMPLITDQGELRRENWGLAEMKISAGYLQHRSISEIGGLEQLKDQGDFILQPIAVPGVCNCWENQNGGIRCQVPDGGKLPECSQKDFCPIKKKLYHLGYRFKVRKPREILLVCSKCPTPQPNWEDFKKHGVYFAEIRNGKCNLFGQGGEKQPITSFDFEYVVILRGGKLDDSLKSRFPFRQIKMTKKELNFSKSRQDPQKLKNAVYKHWLDKLKKRCLKEPPEIIDMQLQTVLNVTESSGSLITDKEVVEFVFQNYYPAMLDELQMKDKGNDEAARNLNFILKLLKSNPPSEFPILQDIKQGNIDEFKFKKILIECCTKLEKEYKFKENYRFKKALNSIVTRGRRNNSILLTPESPLWPIVTELYAAFKHAGRLLRKNQEQLITLPRSYSAEVKGDGANQSHLGTLTDILGDIKIKVGGTPPLISYCRHDQPNGPIYAEALSGEQSYFYTLHQAFYHPKQEDAGLFVRLAENALLRVLIIDERVSNFLKTHEEKVTAFARMRIDAVRISEDTDPPVCKNGISICLNKLPLFAGDKEKKWDILIIHQGIIDKWFLPHGKNQVSKLIENLQKSCQYTVVTTGRGRPDNIPDSVRVLPFPMVQSTLLQNHPEKMLLVNAVMNCLPKFYRE